MRWKLPLLASALLLAGSAVVSAEDWPRWLGPRGNNVSAETGLADSWPKEGPKKLWSQTVGIGFSSPVALDGKIYFFSQEAGKDTLRAFDADKGTVLWSQSYDRGPDPSYPGTRATPTLDTDRIYTYGSGGDLTCRQLADGKQVWHVNVLKETGSQPITWGQDSSPLVTDDLVYVQAGQTGPATVALDKKTGAVAWKSQAAGPGGYAALVIVPTEKQNQLIAFAGQALVAMDPKTGQTLWTENWRTTYDVNAASPVYDGKHLFVSSEYGHGCMMLALAPGAAKEWESREVQCKFQPPILDGQALYANSSGALKCLSWPDGKVAWTFKGRELKLGAGGSLLRVGDNLITLGERGMLSLVRATPTESKLISQVQLFDYDKVWSSPVIYRGKLYVKGADELVCLDISAPKP